MSEYVLYIYIYTHTHTYIQRDRRYIHIYTCMYVYGIPIALKSFHIFLYSEGGWRINA